jgi:hypothetical protein
VGKIQQSLKWPGKVLSQSLKKKKGQKNTVQNLGHHFHTRVFPDRSFHLVGLSDQGFIVSLKGNLVWGKNSIKKEDHPKSAVNACTWGKFLCFESNKKKPPPHPSKGSSGRGDHPLPFRGGSGPPPSPVINAWGVGGSKKAMFM